jgi:hypothetical protein
MCFTSATNDSLKNNDPQWPYPTPRPFYESAVADKVLRKDKLYEESARASSHPSIVTLHSIAASRSSAIFVHPSCLTFHTKRHPRQITGLDDVGKSAERPWGEDVLGDDVAARVELHRRTRPAEVVVEK